MKNITLSVDAETLDTAKLYAAERQTSVNALVREFLEQLGRNRLRARDAMAELRAMSEQSEARLGPDYKFDRDSLYDR
jgi:Family of unknown function (DUF6364)